MSNSGGSSGSPSGGGDSSNSATLCTITGDIIDLQGNSVSGYSFYIRHIHSPIVSEYDIVLGETYKVTSDSDGCVSFNLLQGAKFKIEFPNRIFDLTRICTVPEASTAKFADVVFPRVSSVDFKDAVTSLSVGSTQDYSFTITFSDGTTETNTAGITLSSASPAVATISGTSVVPVGTGTSVISIDSFDETQYEIEDAGGEDILRLNKVSPELGTITVTVA